MPDYGIQVCVSPWPDGGWLAGLCLNDREWVEEQLKDANEAETAVLRGVLTLHEREGFPSWDIFDGYGDEPMALCAHGISPVGAVAALYDKVVGAGEAMT